jgi:hypothetical protein
MKYLYLLVAAVVLIAAVPTQAKAAPANPPQRQGVLSHRPGQPDGAPPAYGHNNRGRNNGNGNRDRYQNPDRNRNDQRGWQRNDDHRRSEHRGEFRWMPPWRWFLRWQWFHEDQGNRGHRGH